MVEDLAISDNGIGVIGLQYKNVVLYDFINNKILSTIPYSNNPTPQVSPNGDYFFVKDGLLHLYKNDNGTATEIWHSQNSDDFYIYYSFLPFVFLLMRFGNINKVQCCVSMTSFRLSICMNQIKLRFSM